MHVSANTKLVQILYFLISFYRFISTKFILLLKNITEEKNLYFEKGNFISVSQGSNTFYVSYIALI